MRKLFTLALFAVSHAVFAQNVINADAFTFQANVIRDGNGFKSCGARGIVAFETGRESSSAYDFSVNIYNDAMALMKAGEESMLFIKGKGWDTGNLHVRTPGPESFWIGVRDDNLTIKPAKYVASNDAGYKIGGVDAPLALRMMFALINNQPMQLSLQFAGQKFDKVIAFQPSVSEADRTTVQACVGALVERMKSENPRLK